MDQDSVEKGNIMPKTLEDIFLQELQDVLSAERQIIKALPQMAENASHEELRTGFEEHLEQTREQVNRLEQVFEIFGRKPRAKKCGGMEGILEEGKEQMEKINDPQLRDAVMIAAAQKVEHYEICAYGTLVTWAEQLGHDDAADLLKETLAEEKETDQKLTELAKAGINEEAMT